MTDSKKRLGQAIKKARWQNLMEQQTMARKLKLDGSAISLLESGKRSPSIKVFVDICNLFPDHLTELLTAAGIKDGWWG